jgi:hypothetical protein
LVDRPRFALGFPPCEGGVLLLHYQPKSVPRTGIEPATFRRIAGCSTSRLRASRLLRGPLGRLSYRGKIGGQGEICTLTIPRFELGDSASWSTWPNGPRDRVCTCMVFRPLVSRTSASAFRHPRKMVGAGRIELPSRGPRPRARPSSYAPKW